MDGEGSQGPVNGVFSMFAMVHTRTFDGPDGPQETVPWDGSPTSRGPFTYASMPCTGSAPVNNVATDLPALGGAVPGSRIPASTRIHPMRFEVTATTGLVALHGIISLTVCQLRPGSTPDPDPLPDGAKPRIAFAWSAEVDRFGEDTATWRGTFSILGGSGRYEHLRGEGDIAGYFFCFEREDEEPRPGLLDGQFAMIGRYRAPASAIA